jgi:CDP-diacylglycerol--serine O-phosphatidyltransferase
MGLNPFPRPGRNMRRVVIVVPSAFTLANLFFGFWSIVSAFNGNYAWAGWFIVMAAVLDMLDGRVARMSNSGTRFGAELDSLVDVISFGVAPALLMYFIEFSSGGRFGWVVCYLFVVCAALRLARYNVQDHRGDSEPPASGFTGMPSPAAGIILATWYPFSQTRGYRDSIAYLDLQHQGLVFLVLLVAALMVSNVRYPKFPRVGFRSLQGWLGLLFLIGLVVGTIVAPASLFFPLGMAYLLFGVARAIILSLLDKSELAALQGRRETPKS